MIYPIISGYQGPDLIVLTISFIYVRFSLAFLLKKG